MKFNLVEINRLSPPGLWDLGVLVSVIAMLRAVIREGVGGQVSLLLYGRMVVGYSESLRDKTRDNLNMRINAWVLQCPVRMAHVRGIIGASAIRRWRKNRLADYALTRHFGDWQRKFPNGFASKDTQPKGLTAPKFTHQTRAYKWKLFALVKIVNVRGFLYRKKEPDQQEGDQQEGEMLDAYYKLWAVELADDEIRTKWTQPRGARTLKPIRFTPDELELEPEEAAEIEPPILAPQDAPKRIEGKVHSDIETNDPLLDWQPP